MKKERLVACDLIRTVSAIGIIIHHLYAELVARNVVINEHWGGVYANGNYGWLFVTVFFILSGAMLYLNYPVVALEDIKIYYYKRWKSIFPMFYLAWIYFYVRRVLETGQIFYKGNPLKFLWTLFGLDGYVSVKFTTYYLIGEWFLGAIIIIYLIYPIVNWMYRKQKAITIAMIFLLFLIGNFYGLSIQTGPFRSIISCLFSFVIGMVLIDRRKLLYNKYVFFISLIFLVLMLTQRILFLDSNILTHILGGILFIVLFYLGSSLTNIAVIRSVNSFIGRLSYPIFLLQHMVIIAVANSVAGKYLSIASAAKYIGLIFCVTSMIVALAWALSVVCSAIMKKKAFLTLESRLLAGNRR